MEETKAMTDATREAEAFNVGIEECARYIESVPAVHWNATAEKLRELKRTEPITPEAKEIALGLRQTAEAIMPYNALANEERYSFAEFLRRAAAFIEPVTTYTCKCGYAWTVGGERKCPICEPVTAPARVDDDVNGAFK